MGVCNSISLEDLSKDREKLTLKCGLEWDNNLLNTTNLSDFSENCSLGYTGSEYSGNEFCVPDDKYNTKFQGKLYFKDLQDKFSKTYQYNLTWYNN